jgi:hypothetical protein
MAKAKEALLGFLVLLIGFPMCCCGGCYFVEMFQPTPAPRTVVAQKPGAEPSPLPVPVQKQKTVPANPPPKAVEPVQPAPAKAREDGKPVSDAEAAKQQMIGSWGKSSLAGHPIIGIEIFRQGGKLFVRDYLTNPDRHFDEELRKEPATA